jgi:predicted RNase H-like HicB family nuclease
MQKLARYRSQALKLAEIELLGGGEGYVARIPGFRGLLATGPTKGEALEELESALIDWIDLALRRGAGLPAIKKVETELVSAR